MCSLLCRLCLSDSVELYNICSVVYDGIQADTVMQEIFNITVSQSDDFSGMCPTCKVTLGEFYKFYNIVLRSHRTLSKKDDLDNVIDNSLDSKVNLTNFVDCYDNYDIPMLDDDDDHFNKTKTDNLTAAASSSKVFKIIEEINLNQTSKPKSIGINPKADEIQIKLNPISTGNLQTIDVSNLPNKLIVQKIAKNFKIINNTGNKKVTKIIVAKNLPQSLLQQQEMVKKIVNSVLKKEAVKNASPPSTVTLDVNKDDDSSEDEVLSKTKTRLIHAAKKTKKSHNNKKVLKRVEVQKKYTLNKKDVGSEMKLKQTRAPSARSKEQLAKLLAQIDEEKKAKEAKKLSRTEYEAGPEFDTIMEDDHANEDDSDVEVFDDESRKLSVSEVEQVYKNGKLIAQGLDLEMLYRRIFGLQCEICDKKFKYLSLLFSHYKEVHKGMGFIRCCKRKFYARYSVNRHLIKHIRPRSVECPICKKVISRKKSLGVHMQVHLPMDQRRYQCGQCKLGFTHMAQLSHHVARRHSDLTNADLFQCDICFKKFTTKPVHDYHRRSVHKEATDLCQECGKTFKTVASLNAHIKRVHTEGGDPRMKCPHCTSICKKSNLKIHIKTVHEHIRKPCPHCGEMIFPKSLRSHIRHKHDSGLLYPCGFCGKRFKCEKYLKFHIVQHTGVPNYVCEYCPKTFASSGNYHTHRKRVHKKELERIAQEKLLDTESVPVYNPEEDKRSSRNQVDCDPELLQSIRYKNPTIFMEQIPQPDQAQPIIESLTNINPYL